MADAVLLIRDPTLRDSIAQGLRATGHQARTPRWRLAALGDVIGPSNVAILDDSQEALEAVEALTAADPTLLVLVITDRLSSWAGSADATGVQQGPRLLSRIVAQIEAAGRAQRRACDCGCRGQASPPGRA